MSPKHSTGRWSICAWERRANPTPIAELRRVWTLLRRNALLMAARAGAGDCAKLLAY